MHLDSFVKEKQSKIMPKKRVPNSMAVSNFNKSRFGASSVGKSTVKGIFAAPPNSNLRPRNY